jgi:transposase
MPAARRLPEDRLGRQVSGELHRISTNMSSDLPRRRPKPGGRRAASILHREWPEAFAAIMTQRHGHRLNDWLTGTEQADLPGINRYVNGVIFDLDAVTVGLSLPFSPGPGRRQRQQNQMLKRQMYGRASFGRPRKRVLLA